MGILRDGGLVALGGLGAAFGGLYRHAATGIPSIDRFPIRGLYVLAFMREFGLTEWAPMLPRLVRLAGATTANESRGLARNFLGDTQYPAGPSIGPYQVYRRTAKELGLYKPPAGLSEEAEKAHYATLRGDLWRMATWKAAVFRSKLEAAAARPDAGFDVLWSAVRRYNGSGPMAEGYRERAREFYRKTWGDPDA